MKVSRGKFSNRMSSSEKRDPVVHMLSKLRIGDKSLQSRNRNKVLSIIYSKMTCGSALYPPSLLLAGFYHLMPWGEITKKL